MEPRQDVRVLSELSWGFDDSGPSYSIDCELPGSYRVMVQVDPSPGYHHSHCRVEEELNHLRDVCPLNIDLRIAILSHECRGRSNGTYYNQWRYVEDDRIPHGLIVLSGKRIPLHPAMTRYLVAHEYGHGVQYAYERLHGMKPDEMEKGYVETFRPDAGWAYGPGKWHTNVGELIANDFRILIAEKEIEFWPHQGYSRPEDVDGLREFWQKVVRELRSGTVEGPMYGAVQEMPNP